MCFYVIVNHNVLDIKCFFFLQCGGDTGKARPTEAHLLREEQPKQCRRGSPADGQAVPAHRPQV